MRTRALKANFAINIAGAAVPLIVSLVVTPIYIRNIGNDRYGVLSIVWVLLGYLGFLDFGLSRAAANALARLRNAPQPARAAVLVTTFALNIGLGLIGSLVLALLGSYLLQNVLNVPASLKPEIASAFPWVVALFPLALVTGVGIGALESRERFLLANVLQVSGGALGQILPVVLTVLVGPSLSVVIPAAALMRGLTVLAVLIVVYRSEGPLTFRHFDRSQARRLLSYGGWVTVSGVINPVLTSSDQFVIGHLLGVGSVTHYAVPMNLVGRSYVVPSALARTLFPRMSQASGEEAHKLAARAWLALTYGYGAVCAPAIMMTPIFFYYWIGPEFATTSALIGQILFLGAWINGLAFVPYELLQSQGRPDITGKFHLAEVLPFTAVLWIGTTWFGLAGAAAAWTLRGAVDALLLFRVSGLTGKDLAPAALPFALMVAALGTSHILENESVWLRLGAVIVIGVLSVGGAFAMVEDLRRLFLQASGRFGRAIWSSRLTAAEPD